MSLWVLLLIFPLYLKVFGIVFLGLTLLGRLSGQIREAHAPEAALGQATLLRAIAEIGSSHEACPDFYWFFLDTGYPGVINCNYALVL